MAPASTPTEPGLPTEVVWQSRPFPNSNFLLLRGQRPSLVDTGFVAHSEQTAALAGEQSSRIDVVVNTHWHSDHVGANALFQSTGAEIAGSTVEARAIHRHDAGCCAAEYLDQPVPEYAVDRVLADGDRELLGDSEWEILTIPGHTPGHIALWNAEHRLAAVGDSVTAYDVGWVSIMNQGTRALDPAIASLRRLRDLGAKVLLPGHGPLVTDPEPAINKAISRLERQRENIDLAVDYGAKRILAFALMIHNGIVRTELESYLSQRAWVTDSAATVGRDVDDFIRNLLDSMLASGAITLREGTVYAAAESTPVDLRVFDLPYPRNWE